MREGRGLTQPEFERLLGVGAKTVVRWERGTVPPNVATDRLIRLVLADRANAERLARWHGLELPEPVGGTDWARLDATTDEDVRRQVAEDPDTAPEIHEAWFAGAPRRGPARPRPTDPADSD